LDVLAKSRERQRAEIKLNIQNDGRYNGGSSATKVPHAIRADAIPSRKQDMRASSSIATPILQHADSIRNLQPSRTGTATLA
jgi:hypothetical protein